MYGYKERSTAAALFIRDQVVVNGYPPTIREIAEHVGYASTSTTKRMLDRMVQDGIIRRGPHGRGRAIQVINPITPDAPRDKRNEL